MDEVNGSLVPEDVILSKIYFIRGQKVMLDTDLADLYGVKTRNLNKSVQRNIRRFPDDFMFKLSPVEFENLMFQFGTSSWGGRRKIPFMYTEQGVAMLSSVLHSDSAILVNIQIIRVFTKMRKMLETNQEILRKLEELGKNDIEQDRKIMLIFEYIKQLEQIKQEQSDFKDRRLIGFKH